MGKNPLLPTSYSILPIFVVSGKEWLIFLAIGWQGCNLGYVNSSPDSFDKKPIVA
jgi:hypothetical protein